MSSLLFEMMCGLCGVRTAMSFILHTAEDGWLMTSTSGISIGPLHRPACVHLLHCSKKHFPFSVVSLTQKKKKTHTHSLYSTLNSRPPYRPWRLSQQCKFKWKEVIASLGFKTLNFFHTCISSFGLEDGVLTQLLKPPL